MHGVPVKCCPVPLRLETTFRGVKGSPNVAQYRDHPRCERGGDLRWSLFAAMSALSRSLTLKNFSEYPLPPAQASFTPLPSQPLPSPRLQRH